MAIPPRPVVVALSAVRRLLHKLADAPFPPEALVLELTTGVSVTHMMATMAELGIADILGDRTLSTAVIAKEAGTDPDTTHRLLRTAAASGLCTMDQHTGAVSLTRVGQVLRRDHPASMRDWAIYMGFRSTSDAWADLTASVRTGESAFARVHGMSVWEWFGRHPEEERTFARAMVAVTMMNAEAIAKAYPWPRGAVVCDVGGGVGTLLAALLESRDDLRGILVDAPGPLAEAATYLAGTRHTGRVTPVAGDLFESVDAQADIYLLKDILHDWDDERCTTILEGVSATMPTGSRLVLAEIVQDPNTPNFFAPFVDLQMLTQTDGGRQRSVEELNTLVRAVGLTPTGRVFPVFAHSLIEAEKP